MTKFSPEYLNLADDLLKQFALAGDDSLSAILNKNLPSRRNMQVDEFVVSLQ